jgi:hypothetical protein
MPDEVRRTMSDQPRVDKSDGVSVIKYRRLVEQARVEPSEGPVYGLVGERGNRFFHRDSEVSCLKGRAEGARIKDAWVGRWF